MTRAATAGAIALLLSCGPSAAMIKGNDTGGIISWSPENRRAMHAIAQTNCGWYGKYAVITSVTHGYGNYIGYVCRFAPPRHRRGIR